jgi:hypothetical protein
MWLTQHYLLRPERHSRVTSPWRIVSLTTAPGRAVIGPNSCSTARFPTGEPLIARIQSPFSIRPVRQCQPQSSPEFPEDLLTGGPSRINPNPLARPRFLGSGWLIVKVSSLPLCNSGSRCRSPHRRNPTSPYIAVHLRIASHGCGALLLQPSAGALRGFSESTASRCELYPLFSSAFCFTSFLNRAGKLRYAQAHFRPGRKHRTGAPVRVFFLLITDDGIAARKTLFFVSGHRIRPACM